MPTGIKESVHSTIHGGTVDGATISFGNLGHITRSTGQDGSGNPTDVIEMMSFGGLKFQAYFGGMSLAATGGIWLNDATHIDVPGKGNRDIGVLLGQLMAATGVN